MHVTPREPFGLEVAARNQIAQRDGRSRRPDTSGSVASALAVAAGYGLAISALIVLTVERMFGTRGMGARLAVLGMTVAALVAGAAVMCARRALQRRRPGRGKDAPHVTVQTPHQRSDSPVRRGDEQHATGASADAQRG